MYKEPEYINSIRRVYINKDEITKIFTENYKLIKYNNIREKDDIILNTFNGCEFFERKEINKAILKNCFIKLTQKPT